MSYTPKDWKDYPDTSTPITAAALEDLETRVVEYGNTYVTALPSSPVDGQEVYYAADATNGVIWHLRYRSGGGTYKWECVGGGPLYAYDSSTFEGGLTINAYTAFASDTLAITLPVAGDYEITFGGAMWSTVGNTYVYLVPAATGLSATAANAIAVRMDSGDTSLNFQPSRSTVVTGISGSLILKYYVTNASSGYNRRWLMAKPIRVG